MKPLYFPEKAEISGVLLLLFTTKNPVMAGLFETKDPGSRTYFLHIEKI